ncbi:hypothetical protein VTL71DRAFT_9857 [Oculimacula yallundae]|uniref:Protein kinase domain-containing protein n=1 Tax=Oculimacula yallundae TaxID=86028 RepID=A0ABR4BQR5_9HELO
MAANPRTAAFYDEYREWEAHNDGPLPFFAPSTDAQIDASYLATPFALPPVAPRPPPRAPTALQAPLRAVIARRQVVDPPTPVALLAPFPTYPGGYGGPNWTGVKHLGTGGGGTVTLWEYTGPAAGRPPIHDRIVAKKQELVGGGLLFESQYMMDLNAAMSEHIVKLLVDPTPALTAASAAAEGLHPRWAGQRRLEELTLWKIFQCLVDGCAVLEHGFEYIYVGGIAQIPPNSISNHVVDPGVLVHFDMKLENVMCARVTGAAATHPDTPICKIGDFGLSLEMRRDSSGRDNTGIFPLAWNLTEGAIFRSMESLELSNGPSMWQIRPSDERMGHRSDHVRACYDQPTVEAHRPFYPGPLRLLAPLGRVFGVDIQAVPLISAMLKDTIQECLYEIPSNRPLLLDLKRLIMVQIDTLVQAGIQPEGWEDLERLEPLTPLQDQQVQFGLGKVRCTALRVAARVKTGIAIYHSTNNRLCTITSWDQSAGRYTYGLRVLTQKQHKIQPPRLNQAPHAPTVGAASFVLSLHSALGRTKSFVSLDNFMPCSTSNFSANGNLKEGKLEKSVIHQSENLHDEAMAAPAPPPPPVIPPGLIGPVTTAAFLTANPTFSTQFLYWYSYNNPAALGAGAIPLPGVFIPVWRTRAFVQAPLGPLPFAIPPPVVVNNAMGVLPPPKPGPTPAQLGLLTPPFAPRGIGKRPANWKGRKILGIGGQGAVCLWEWNPKATSRPTIDHRQVVVKLALATKSLRKEGAIMMRHRRASSDHIVKLLARPKVLSGPDCTRENLDPMIWQGRINRLIMEYCPHGSLEELLERREARNFPFKELTLWRIFECLVDGCSVLTYGEELKIDGLGRILVPTPAPQDVVVHLDMKPDNIFADLTNMAHAGLPIYKIGDFGFAETFDSNPNNVAPSDIFAEDFDRRLSGTARFYAPEQFTRRWDFNDFMTSPSPVCGKYGTATNVWGIGVIMMVCYNKLPPKPHRPFTYTTAAGASFTAYGTEFNRQRYSPRLKDLIYRCLAEDPSVRPGLPELKTIIRDNVALEQASGSEIDNWYDMEVPDPATYRADATDNPPAVPPAGRRITPFREATLKRRATRGWPVY